MAQTVLANDKLRTAKYMKIHEQAEVYMHTNQLQVEFWGHMNFFEGGGMGVTCQQALWYAAHST